MRSTFILRIIVFICTFITGYEKLKAQPTGLYPYAQEIIKFDLVTNRADKAIPFDKPFVLIVENISTDNIQQVALYRSRVKNGGHALYLDKPTESIADYVFSRSEWMIEKTKLTIKMPALKPSKDFDILILRKFSGRNHALASALDKIILDNSLDPTRGGFAWPVDATAAYKILKDSANNENFTPPVNTFSATDIDQYYSKIFTPAKPYYTIIRDDSKYKTLSNGAVYIGGSELIQISRGGPANARPFNDAYLLERILKETTEDGILLGLLPVGYQAGAKLTEEDEYEKRVANLGSSIQFFDTLYSTVSEMAGKDNRYDNARDQVYAFLLCLQGNKKVLTDNLKEISKIRMKFFDATWLIGTTESRDLQTKSSSIFTLDAGFTNIWARDLNNKVTYIPKLYWGVNIYFRGTDKNIRSRYIPKKKKAGIVNVDGKPYNIDYDIITRKTMFTHLCLTIGFTFGSLDKQNFDNFFAGSSMIVGPSIRLSRSFRISSGAAFLKRTNSNPLLSDKRITMGGYLAASLDLDILHAIKNATNLFFK